MLKDIVFVITDITGRGGTERTTCNLANTFCEYNHRVTIISLFKKGHAPAFHIRDKIEIVYVSQDFYSLNTGIIRRFLKLFSLILPLRGYLKKYVQSSIISQSFLPSFLIWLAGKSRQTIVCEHLKYAIYIPVFCKFRDLIYIRFKRLILLTDNEIKLYSKWIKKISIIPNMVFISPLKANLSHKKMIAAGRLSYEKGFDLLLQAMPAIKTHCPDWIVEIYGEGELYKELQKQIELLKLDHYVFLRGFTEHIGSKMLESSIYIMSSRNEGLPMVMLEAMSHGLAIVSFDCPTGPGILLGEGAGILVEPENTEALANAIIKLTRDEHIRKTLAEKAINKADEYSPQNIYKEWLKIINE